MAGRANLVEDLWESVDGLTKGQAAEILDAVLAAIRAALARGERVTVPRFGAFSVHRRPARPGRSPATGAPIRIRESFAVRFRPPDDLLGPARPSQGTERIGTGRRPSRRRPDETRRRGERAGGAPRAPSRGTAGRDLGVEVEGAYDTDTGLGHDTSGGGAPDEAYEAPPRVPYHRVEVFYATDRKPGGSRPAARHFGSTRGDGSLEYGVCEVSIPRDHRMGALEGPSWRRLELRRDPREHVVLLSLRKAEAAGFFAELSACLEASVRGEILLFLHGFNVSFEDAARRTAQLAYDLKLEGAPVFYSWPSKGKLSLTGYAHDETNVEWTVPHLKSFLVDLASGSGARAIHLIAHSMGNRALTRALGEIAATMAAPGTPAFSEVVLTAPDIDADVFRQMASALRRAARRVTLYASDKDRALEASRKFHGYPRAGDAGANIVVVPEVETIDASAVDTDLVGHFYYGDNRSVLSDVYYLLRDGKSAGERFGLSERRSASGSYWVFLA